MILKRFSSFPLIIFSWNPKPIWAGWAGTILFDVVRLTLFQYRFDNFRKLMLFRSSCSLKKLNFHSTFLLFSLFFCYFQWSTIFNGIFYKILYRTVVFSLTLFFLCFDVNIIKWLAGFSFRFVNNSKTKFNLKSKAIQEQNIESKLLHEN